MNEILITGTGLFTPPESITNTELVSSFNHYVAEFNATHAQAIANNEIEALKESDEEFIFKASGIKNRYVMNKASILDIKIMQPILAKRADSELSLQAEMAVCAAKEALIRANLAANEIDAVIVACSNLQRPYPAIAIEVQKELGISGFAFDMNVACSSATFAIQTAYSTIKSDIAKRVMIVMPEICSAHLNFKDRDSHFIFGDVCTAVIIETGQTCKSSSAYKIIATKTKTEFSNNIRNNFGFLTKTESEVFKQPSNIFNKDYFFMQQGRKVFKEIIPMVAELIANHLAENNIAVKEIKRFWLHQANANINRLVTEKLLGNFSDERLVPSILNDYANTSSPGCIIAFHKYNEDLKIGDIGVLCSFGAGYSIGNIILEKIC
ncbi:MAG: beta-ketoacyl-ACP synthase III [Gammaproteobacteria bacterium RIFCSPHIGHO2_12_FULL_35_23]|nr:MAG: beta-ketoacyl-ACP synthase III [Gammaproteobacteria bacterium RIFCSPHIGHO2_12_FULL_35_23]